jgi:hypothetical protein
MVSFRGSMKNLPFPNRVLIWALGCILPIIGIVLTAGAVNIFSWWPLLLIPDIILVVISISLSGMMLRGQSLSFLEGEIDYVKGWTKIRIPIRNLKRVYRVFSEKRDSIVIIFNEPSSKKHPNRCLTIGQVFHEKDRTRIFKMLKKKQEKIRFDLIDMATLDQFRLERMKNNWISV